MKRLLLITAVTLALAAASGAGAAVAWRVLYVHPGTKIYVRDLDFMCVETNNAGTTLPTEFACGNASTANGPYVRVFPTKIVIASTSQRTLLVVKRDR